MALTPIAFPLSLLLALAGPASQPAASPTTNPAELDERAFGLVNWEREANASVLDEPATVPLGPEVTQYLADRKPVVALLRQAASMPKSYWGDTGGDMQKVLDRLNHARHCVNLLVLQSRQDLAEGHPEVAVGDLLAAMALARHVGGDGLIVERMVEWGAESAVIDQFGREMSVFPKSLVAALPARLAALPMPSTMKEMFGREFAFGGQMLAAKGATPDILALLSAAKPFYDALAEGADVPPAEFQALVDAEAAKLKDNAFVQLIAPSIKRVTEGYAVIRSKRAMLDVAIHVVADGPDAAAKSTDPCAQPPAPFAFEKTPEGFALTGATITKNGPVSLRVGP